MQVGVGEQVAAITGSGLLPSSERWWQAGTVAGVVCSRWQAGRGQVCRNWQAWWQVVNGRCSAEMRSPEQSQNKCKRVGGGGKQAQGVCRQAGPQAWCAGRWCNQCRCMS